MASLDLEKLLKEVSADSPCGNDLEYEPEFQELERSTQYRAEQQIGDAIVEAAEPSWKDVQRAAVELFAKTKDLRISVYLARAALHNEGFAGFRDGLALIKGLLEKYWDAVHPRLDPEDNNDPTFRVNTISWLADPDTVLRSVKMTPAVAARGVGQFNIRDIDLAKGILQPATGSEESIPELGIIDAAFMQCELTELQANFDAVKQCRDHIVAIEKIFTAKVSAAQSPNLSELNKILHHIGGEISQYLERRGVASTTVGQEAGGEQTMGTQQAAPISGDIKNREDVIRMLDKICDFYKQHEPSHPLPILLQRAKRLVRKDFMEILKDIAPDALKQAELLRGKE